MWLGVWKNTVWLNFMTLCLQMAEITVKQQKRARFWHWAIWRPIRVFVKIKILKFRFFHVTRNTIRYVVAKFLGPRISNGWDYCEQPILAQIGTYALENQNLENTIFSCYSGHIKRQYVQIPWSYHFKWLTLTRTTENRKRVKIDTGPYGEVP